MTSYRKILSSLVVMATMTIGCSQQQFGLDSQSQEFGNKIAYNTEVDVLWVIDTSSSMDKHQALLAAQVGSFVDSLNKTGLNYRIAVTTMDMSASGAKGKFLGTPAVLTASTPGLTSVLSARLQPGAGGSPVERGLEALKASVSAPLSSAGGTNENFLRPNALLAVIFLSNEDDQSASADYGAFLDTVRPPLPSGERSWVAQFMGVTPDDPTCKTSEWDQAGYSEVGLKYIALADESGGNSEAICDADLRRALTNVKSRILEILTEYKLASVPNLSTLEVYINGALVPQDAVNGWSYFASTNSIRFHGSSVPRSDASIKVNYDPAGVKE
ncbi:MAG: hypothetical protein V4760_10220 [Bdellovibrionota bacterium]